jgi:hypothetical protein
MAHRLYLANPASCVDTQTLADHINAFNFLLNIDPDFHKDVFQLIIRDYIDDEHLHVNERGQLETLQKLNAAQHCHCASHQALQTALEEKLKQFVAQQ